jgi:hypothetical protein
MYNRLDDDTATAMVMVAPILLTVECGLADLYPVQGNALEMAGKHVMSIRKWLSGFLLLLF